MLSFGYAHAIRRDRALYVLQRVAREQGVPFCPDAEYRRTINGARAEEILACIQDQAIRFGLVLTECDVKEIRDAK